MRFFRSGGEQDPPPVLCPIADNPISETRSRKTSDRMSSILVQVIVGGLLLGAVYALFSSGLTLVWGMMNIVNFAHGDFVMLGMYVAFVVWTLVRRRAVGGCAARRAGARDAWRRRLFRTDPRHHERADAGPDPRHLRARAVAALFGILVVRRELPVAAGKSRRRHVRVSWACESRPRACWPAWSHCW